MRSERRRIWSGLIVAVFVTMLAFVSVGCAADTYTVCPGGGCNYTSIQAAIDAASAGDTIIVRDGTYTENVVVDVANLTLQSENGSAVTTVVAAVNSSDVFRVTANSVTITGFNVRNATDSASGIHLDSVHHCTVSGNNASGNFIGIRLDSSSTSNNLASNNASNNGVGIFLHSSSNNNTLTGNIANSNNLDGIYLSSSSNNIVVGNSATNHSRFGIWVTYSSTNNNLTGNTANSNYVGISLFSSSNNNTLINNTANSNSYGIKLGSSSNNNTLTGNTATNNWDGILLDSSSNNTIANNTASNNKCGIRLASSSNNALTGNIASNNGYGISLLDSSNNTIANNTASNNSDRGGIHLLGSSNNKLTGNMASNNSYGICLDPSSNKNKLVSNTAANNSNRGIYLDYTSNNNHIYNNYLNNANNAWDGGNNIWNISEISGTNIIGGPWLGGNYWSDYNGNDTNGDGLGDTPYNISGGTNKDYLPLVAIAAPQIFDTGEGSYPSISGTFTGTITPSSNTHVSTVYTYSCPGTGGHTKFIQLYEDTTLIASGVWSGYQGDWHNITLTEVTLLKDHEYRYIIETGSYPQIIHAESKDVTGGIITCTEFVDINGKQHEGWIPAIRLS
jgi:parallel beta-helix repeat protein